MNKPTKQIVAFLLAICSMVTFMMPTVFATAEPTVPEGTDTLEERPADLTVDFATAFANAGIAEFTYLQNAVPQWLDAYEENQWTVYCGGTDSAIRPNSLYAGGRFRGNHLEVQNHNIPAYGATAIMPTVFKAPGTGEYRLTVNYGIVSSDDKQGSELGAYILEMPTTHYTKYNIPNPTDSRILAKAYTQAPATSGTLTAGNTVALKEGVEYILVFYVVSPDEEAHYAHFKNFSLTYEPTDTEPAVDMTVDFATAFANAGIAEFTYLQNAVSQWVDAYEENQWTVYCGGTANAIRPNSLYAGGRFRGNHLEVQNYNIPAYGATAMLPTVFKAPGTGEYRLSVDYGTVSADDKQGSELGAYILEMPGTHYTKYNVPSPNDDRVLAKAYTQAPVASGTLTAENTVSLRRGVEYILVFYVISPDEEARYAHFKNFSLTFEQETIEPVSQLYTFYTPELGQAYTKLVDKAAELKTAFDAGNSNWRFEAADSNYQFRPVGGNQFREDHGALSYVTGGSNASNTCFFAIRIQSPGEGKFDLTFTHSGNKWGAKKGSAYIVDAAVIDEALGENADAYAEAMAANVYEPGEGIYDAYKAAVTNAIKGKNAAMVMDYTVAGTAEARVAFEAEKEYVIVFTSDVASGDLANIYLVSLLAVYSENQEDEPEGPAEPAYTDGLYNFNDILKAGTTMLDSMEILAAMYDENQINWKYEAKGGGLDLNKVSYHGATDSVRALASKDWWIAFRIKAPAQDGQYAVQMTHGATGEGAPAGSVYVLPGTTDTSKIFKVASKKNPIMIANWNYGEKATDAIKNRVTTGTVNMKAGEEYILVFQPTEPSPVNGNSCYYMGKIQLTRTGDYVEEEDVGLEEEGVEYEFYDWDNPGQYVNHFRTEEELGKKKLDKQIEAKYAAGDMNWCYFPSNGYASFSTGTPYLSIGVGDTDYYVMKIKSPGTGTYEITYNHMAMKDAHAGTTGGVYIVPYEEGVDYKFVRDEANFKDPIITTNYYADKTTQVTVTGTYTAFQEGKEYLVCFSAADADTTTSKTVNLFPASMVMKRTGDYVPEGSAAGASGIVYDLALREFAGKRSSADNIHETIADRYAKGIMNWKLESGSGYAEFFNKYTSFATGSDGGCWAIRIKAPGTGEYKVTLDYVKNFVPYAANVGKIYIKEAPEETISGSALKSHLVQESIIEVAYNCDGTRMQRDSNSGTYMFKEGKEYIVIFFGQDDMDSTNPITTTYMYAERLTMQRVGEYVETEKALAEGGIVAENVLTQFKSEGYMLTQMNGHDYLVFTMFGGTMLIYDLDEWRLVDEVKIGIDTPRSICQDLDGNWWIAGASQSLYCYNPYTREGFLTSKFSSGGDHFEVVCDPEDGNLYLAAYSDFGIIIYRINPKTLDVKSYRMEAWSRYPGPGSCIIKGDYMYLTATSGDHCEVWKVNKRTCTIVGRTDITNQTKRERYVYNMSFMGDNHLLVYSGYGVLAVDTRDMSMIFGDETGLEGTSSRIASEPIDGKCYFVTNAEGLCYFDLETETFGAVGGDLINYKTGLRVANLATIEDSRLTEKTMISFGGMSDSGVNLYCINLETKTSVELIGLVEPGMGTGVNAHALFKGEPGSNTIIYGPMFPDFPARVYNAATGELAQTFYTCGQNDSYTWYNGKMYFGNYSSAILCEMNNGQPTQLFMLNDKNFDQSRVHGICAGDNKVFIGTIPDNYIYGGLVAWYDLETELTYVVTGPNPEDVYYAKASKTTATSEWYSVATGELVDMTKEWDNDNDGDGVYDHFSGLVPMQSIAHIVYSDGLLYGVTTIRGGSGAPDLTEATSMIFVYDVENMKLLKTVDVADHIEDVPTVVRVLKSLEVDPDISNKLWGMVSETLFSMTYDRDTNKVTIKEELSFNRSTVSKTSSSCMPMIFDGDYIYALFGPIGGLLKVNRNDPSQYTKLMGDFETTDQVPTSFVLGDDGDIYYISQTSPHIYVLNADITDEERAAAKAVQDTIDLIPETITLADRATIEAARAAWDAMPKANQPLVNNLKKLENAEVALLTLRIDALSGDITIEDEAELMAIRAEYMALDLEQRLSIDFLKVSQAESKMSILRGERTSNLINSIGEVTLDKEQLIRDARASFMALTRYERTLVKNIDVLNAAEAVLTGLLLRKSEASAVDKLIDKIGFVFFGDGAKISAARKAYNKLDDETKEMVEQYTTLVAAEIILVAEYLIVAAAVTCGVLYTIPATRVKIFKKKETAVEE